MATETIVQNDPDPPEGSGLGGSGIHMEEASYAATDMQALFMEYELDTETLSSTKSRATLYAGKASLNKRDIVDMGISKDSRHSRFALEVNLMRAVEQTVSELQELAKRASSLIAGRNTYFIVDPFGSSLTTLRGCDTLAELNVAWTALRTRMGLAQKYLLKYQSEYEHGENSRLQSPVSTNPTVYDSPRNSPTAMQQFKHIYMKVPHMRDQLTFEQINTLRAGGVITEVMPPPSPLLLSFPDREPEVRPATIYYDERGERQLRSIPARTSYKAGKEFQLPSDDSLVTRRNKGPRKSVAFSASTETREPTYDKDLPPHMEPEYVVYPVGNLTSTSSYGGPNTFNARTHAPPFMGDQTMYKDEASFFKSPSAFLQPGTPRVNAGQPEVLYGAASSFPYGKPRGGTNYGGRRQSYADLNPGDIRSARVEELEVDEGNKTSSKSRATEDDSSDSSGTTRTYRASAESSHSGAKFNAGNSSKESPRDRTEGTGFPPKRNGSEGNAPGDNGEGWSNKPYSFEGYDGYDDPGRFGGRRPPDPPDGDGDPPDRRNRPDRSGPPRPPGPPGGGGNGGNGGGGGGGPPNPGGGGFPHPFDADGNPVLAPYGTMMPTIKPELKQDELPTWDGNHDTAITYFWNIQELAALGGWLPQALGYWLWKKLESGSDVQEWWQMLDRGRKDFMRSHYLNYLEVIKREYLGKNWQQRMNLEFGQQRFRQKGHEDETPQKFISRRIMYTRMLANADYGGPLEVYVVMTRAPISWGTILHLDGIPDSATLYSRVVENSDALAYAGRSLMDNVVTTSNLSKVLRQLGVTMNANPASRWRNEPSKRANLTQFVPRPEEADEEETSEDFLGSDSNDDRILKEAYQTLKRNPRPPPKGGYPFPKNDSVTTQMGRLPPSPCKVCGSKNHWDKECPNWSVYLERERRNAKLAAAVVIEDDTNYSSAYSVFLNRRLASDQVDVSKLADETPSDFKSAVPSCPQSLTWDEEGCKPEAIGASTRRRFPVTMEVVEDESWETQRGMPTAIHGVMESDEEDDEGVQAEVKEAYSSRTTRLEEEYWSNDGRMHLEEKDCSSESFEPNEQGEDRAVEETFRVNDYPEPTSDEGVLRLPKKRFRPAGCSAVGVSVLMTRGWVSSLADDPVDIRIDSGADVSLMSEELYNSLRSPPPMRQGVKLQLWQLTDKTESLRGYTTVPIIMTTVNGQKVQTEAEVYIVPGMTVPLLLGEDYQLNFELSVDRNVERGTHLTFGGTDHEIAVEGVNRSPDFKRMRQSAYLASHFVKKKLHRRAKAKRRSAKRAEEEARMTVRASKDYRLRPHECKPIEVVGDLGVDREWLVEKTLLSHNDQSYFAVPNVLITASKPWIPVCNPSDRPHYIRKGEIMGRLHKPETYFDTPRTEEEFALLNSEASRIKVIVEANMALGETTATSDTESKQESAEDEDYGPKTAAMPDLTVYPSAEMETLIDVGELPDHLKVRAWEMLARRQRAFGFDGRLGHHPARVHIRTVDGQVPIAVPMYGSSPAKRQVMDEQIDKWYQMGVIEESKSPWSAPVVIAYRNGKARFCVDYRKLNAVTIPDEFPIPRQTEILSSLSGAQVLSSLDALSGFTQLEMDPSDVEKTAFRTHRGLFQFRRMPFGLRNGPSIFQRVMQSVLAPYLWIFCLVYIDDIVIYSKSYEDHIVHLDKVLGAIEDAGITLSPTKCHLFYSSILLLGHKVSRLGLSTHLEKVRAILELERPKKISQVQTFLGMAVYFSSFIPYYASICTPLFQLLRQGAKWQWGAEHEFAFKAVKDSLRSAPVLGHPIEGLPYRLYTDASDEALGCALQQVQPIAIRDLRGTRAYDRLRKAFDAGLPPPRLVTSLTTKIADVPAQEDWGTTFDETIVHVERVIGYWSRTFKGPEQRYSTTEREALGAKEGLVKFLPFIEGEKVILVTDHSALQWARTYENANRRLAAWGVVFSAYPGLEIVHRAGRVHSNVDPLSRLPRVPPGHVSPAGDSEKPIIPDSTQAEDVERLYSNEPARRATFVTWDLEECLEGRHSVWAVTRGRSRAEKLPPVVESGGGASTTAAEVKTDASADSADIDALSDEYWSAVNPPPSLHVQMEPKLRSEFVEGYQEDPAFKTVWKQGSSTPDHWMVGSRFFQDENGLLFFQNADYQPRLCVPRSLQNFVLSEAHDSPLETAHGGPEKLFGKISQKFYWHRMKVDVVRFCRSCDVCQKTKPSNFNKYGYLIPNPIPSRPYESVSMDFVVNLPMSDGYNAVYVVVDRLTKHAQFIPTTTAVTTTEFASLFTKNVVCRFGLPDSIVTDRDPRWTSDFWRAVAKFLKTRMSLSSAHHPQHDGQTEIVNKQLGIMLRAYTAGNKESWAEWLHLLEFAYNSAIHSSTGASPYYLLYGFNPKSPLDFASPDSANSSRALEMDDKAVSFLETLAMHRDSARLAVAKAQNDQAKSYNRGRREPPVFKEGSRVLVNPHTLEWVESKSEGKKLTQRWIGPFEVLQRINPNVYRLKMSSRYPGSPVVNVQHLKAYVESPPELGKRPVLPETRLRKPEEPEFDVEKIIAHRFDKRKKKIMYLVRWEGYGPQFDTWEPAVNVKNSPLALAKYHKQSSETRRTGA